MILRRTAPRAKTRWLLLGFVVIGLTGLAASSVLGHGATSIPSNFFTVADQGGVDDVNSDQVDLTQFGRDDTDATKYKLFWSWDSHDSWTGNGQTGDACALFDNDGDGKINFAVCARVANLSGNTEDVRLTQQDATHPVFAFTCSDAKNDRCAQPTGPLGYTSPTQIDAGVLSTLAKANLITETDPFPTGEDSPHDTTLEVDILKAFVPGTEVLVNVCSYPSAGNGGNNNPFDCIVNPGGGFLSIVKDAGAGATSPTFDFSVNTSPATTRSINGSNTATPVSLGITTTAAVTETSIPSPWVLQNTTSCKLADGTTQTGTLDLANNRVTGITIQSGLVTTCTFVDRIPNGTLVVIKHVINDNGGTATADQFTYALGDGSSATNEPGAESPGTPYTRQIGTNYDVTENGGGPSGYGVSYSGCSGTIASGTQTCTITNDDQAATLTVIKHVINDNGGTKAAADWTLDSGGTDDSPDDFAGSEDGTTVSLSAGSYDVTESGPSGYTASFSAACSGTIANGQTKTCTVTNNDAKASPGITTTMKWTLNDSVALTGFRPGGTGGTATFSLYKDDPECDDTPVFSESAVAVNNANGTAATSAGYATDVPGTYRWVVAYSGNNFNDPITSICGSETTTLP